MRMRLPSLWFQFPQTGGSYSLQTGYLQGLDQGKFRYDAIEIARIEAHKSESVGTTSPMQAGMERSGVGMSTKNARSMLCGQATALWRTVPSWAKDHIPSI